MIWLLKLYPPRWRRRYEAEVAELVAARPFSIGGALDLVGGAVDAWRHPELIAAAANSAGGASMIARVMGFECAGYGPQTTRSDRVKQAAVNIGGTLLLTAIWFAAWVSKRQEMSADGQAYLAAAAPMAYLLPYAIGLRYTSLKGRSAFGQAVAIATISGVVLAILMTAGWISTKL
jgi:hypothetical protein